jgi:hypothetical protein
MYVLGCRLSLFRLCGSDFGITAVDDITNGITWAVFCFHIAHISFDSSIIIIIIIIIISVASSLGSKYAFYIENGFRCSWRSFMS